jgi:hypothetical protein
MGLEIVLVSFLIVVWNFMSFAIFTYGFRNNVSFLQHCNTHNALWVGNFLMSNVIKLI